MPVFCDVVYTVLADDADAIDRATFGWRGADDVSARDALDTVLAQPLDPRQLQREAEALAWIASPEE